MPSLFLPNVTSITKHLRSDVGIALLLFVGFLVLRIPFRAEFLINWDAANFALGTQLFNLEHHQPHPPGYIGFIALGWALNHITGDANTSLTAISIVSGALAPVGLFLFAKLWMPQRYAIPTAILFGLSPVVWYYSGVALTYSAELALGLFFLWTGFRARADGSFRYMLVATVLLILLGAMRQSGALFLMPLWLYLIWAFPWRARFQVGTVLVLGNLAWLIPLLVLSGGIRAYIEASAGLASLAVMPTSIFAMNPFGSGQNIAFVLAGIIVGVNLGLAVIVAGFFAGGNALMDVVRRDKAFFALWLVPLLLTYLLLHTGQLGYVLLLLPAFFLWMGASLARVDAQQGRERLRSAAAAGGQILVRRYVVSGLVALLAFVNVLGFFLVPQAVHALAEPDEPNAAHKWTTELFETLPLFGIGDEDRDPDSGVAKRARQYNVEMNDAHWRELIEFVERFDPDETVILAAPHGAGSFRHLTYYLPDYRLFGLGRDLDERFGHLFTAYGGTSTYATDGLEEAQQELRLSSDVEEVIIPDEDIYERLDPDFPQYKVTLPSGVEVVVAIVPSETTLVVENADSMEDARLEPDGDSQSELGDRD